MEDFSTIRLTANFTAISVLWIAVHFLGFFAAWMVRMHAGKLFAQLGFFMSLLAVAMTTVVGHLCCLEMWPLSAVTLALMIVLAIVDFGIADSATVSLER